MDRNTWSVIGVVVVIGVALWIVFTPKTSDLPEIVENTNATSTMNGIEMYNSTSSTLGTKKEVVTSDVAYYGKIKGFLAKPKEAGTYPGVVMIHEWWGLNDTMKDMARTLASEGYVVLAVDLYGVPATTSSTEARALTAKATKAKTEPNLKAATKYLRDRERVAKIVSLGWCFGGGKSLELALSGERLYGTVIYYGQLVTSTTQLAKIDWPVLGVFGGKDTSIPVENVKAFESALDDLDVPNDVYIYDNVGHAFANPTGPNYAPNETKDAWGKTLTFLKDVTR